MMYGLFVLFLCSMMSLDGVTAAVAIYPPEDKPEDYADEEGCFNSDLGLVLPYEEPYSPQDGTSCIQYTCRKDNFTFAFTCGAMSVGDGCIRIPGNNFLPYPDCCDDVYCE